MARSPEVTEAPSWFRDPLVDQFTEDRVVRGRFKSVSPKVIDRLRRRQFNSQREDLVFQRALLLSRAAEKAIEELVALDPEWAEVIIRSQVKENLGGRVLVPTNTRKINRKD
jgi:hypothetical protein